LHTNNIYYKLVSNLPAPAGLPQKKTRKKCIQSLKKVCLVNSRCLTLLSFINKEKDIIIEIISWEGGHTNTVEVIGEALPESFLL
jgi:hypothetical protein